MSPHSGRDFGLGHGDVHIGLVVTWKKQKESIENIYYSNRNTLQTAMHNEYSATCKGLTGVAPYAPQLFPSLLRGQARPPSPPPPYFFNIIKSPFREKPVFPDAVQIPVVVTDKQPNYITFFPLLSGKPCLIRLPYHWFSMPTINHMILLESYEKNE